AVHPGTAQPLDGDGAARDADAVAGRELLAGHVAEVLGVDARSVPEDLGVLHVHDDEPLLDRLDNAVALTDRAAHDGPPERDLRSGGQADEALLADESAVLVGALAAPPRALQDPAHEALPGALAHGSLSGRSIPRVRHRVLMHSTQSTTQMRSVALLPARRRHDPVHPQVLDHLPVVVVGVRDGERRASET